ncbi:hypothetical protein K2173_000881 [Erythroxylum novogranatense]|uniref:BHLH domain-containing protein n=1 Tax=Erythroxylum novogranatense TaxID=1862640 RepID=A0AAV8TQ91_9ROSI|nr:hypothetical protein K2173_000881 [Erythroxylum novogranatense]
MEMNQSKFSVQTWNPEMAMEDHQVLNDHIPFSPLWPVSYTLQNQQQSSSYSSVHISISTLLGDQVANPKDEDDQQEDEPEEELGAVKEMMYKIASMQPVDIDPASIRKPKRRNVRISDDPQSVAARRRRERISEKIRILQRLVPGGTKMDTASMLDEAIRYVKFLKRQIRLLQSTNQHRPFTGEWPVTYNRPLGSAVSTSMETPVDGSAGFNLGVNGVDVTAVCFDPQVITD